MPQLVAQYKGRINVTGTTLLLFLSSHSHQAVGNNGGTQFAPGFRASLLAANKSPAAIFLACLPLSSPEARPLDSCLLARNPIQILLPFVKSIILDFYVSVQISFYYSTPAVLTSLNKQ